MDKYCKHCDSWKDESLFRKNYICRACESRKILEIYYQKKDDKEYMERRRTRDKAYYRKNKDKIREKNEKNREARIKYQREYYQKNKQWIKEKRILKES